MRKSLLSIAILAVLTGCWSNQELDDTSLVHGVGLDKGENNKIHGSFEIIQPTGESDLGTDNDESEGQGTGDHLVLEIEEDTLLEGARELIKYTKRRADFGHAKTWIIGDELAKDDFVQSIDILLRDQMLRLNSFLFVTEDDPTEILNTPTMYENLVSTELSESLKHTKFNATYAPITIREFYKLLDGPLRSAYIPMIYLEEVNNNVITAIDGTAIIKDRNMVGQLDMFETGGLNILLNQIKGGDIEVNLQENEKVSLTVLDLKTTTTPKLEGDQLEATIQTKIEGILSDNITRNKISKSFFKEIETAISNKVENVVRKTLNKLQKELKTDITKIGLETYRKYPKQWNQISSDWEDIFSDANISIDIDTTILHKGLIDNTINRHKQPYNNPFHFLED